MPHSNAAPFSMQVSSNAIKFVLHENWDYTRHYPAVFNAYEGIMKKWHAEKKSWAVVTDWRNFLVKVPAEERLCVLSLSEFVDHGLTFYSPVTQDAALARWQYDRISREIPELKMELFHDFDLAEDAVKAHGFDTDFERIPYDNSWSLPSQSFKDRVVRLGHDPRHFGVTV